jgi:hypothetical protein
VVHETGPEMAATAAGVSVGSQYARQKGTSSASTTKKTAVFIACRSSRALGGNEGLAAVAGERGRLENTSEEGSRFFLGCAIYVGGCLF